MSYRRRAAQEQRNGDAKTGENEAGERNGEGEGVADDGRGDDECQGEEDAEHEGLFFLFFFLSSHLSMEVNHS